MSCVPRSKGLRELDDLQAVFQALAHPARRHILIVVWFRGGEMTAGEIANRFSCSWPTTSRHLKVLETAGLLCVERRGRERMYRVDSTRLQGVIGGWLHHFEEKPS